MDVEQMMLPAQRAGGARTAPPQRDPRFGDVDLPELRHRRSGLTDEESRVSYWRRIIQARIDLIDKGDRVSVADGLSRVLADSRSSHRRIAALSVDSAEGLPPLPDLADLWQRMAPQDSVDRAELLTLLREAEFRLSEYRRELHARIDQVTGELIARYRENPALALTALHERLGATV